MPGRRMIWNVLDTISWCARELQKWKGVSIGKILRDLNRKRRHLSKLNESVRTVDNVKERKSVVKDINNLLRQEETFWRQRSRALWLKDGDRNTKYFHRKGGQRKQKNKIWKGTGGEKDVKAAAVDFFRKLFQSSHPSVSDDILEDVRGRVTEEMNVCFRAEYKGDEVVEALNQMHPLKALGPDGMNELFYQT
ncbi:uncharacterized protein LOC141639532 [Silene latifolia]|uniref:uncharacterized protein LOC141639532 n=1 Tax=Silene latifolia TaxID=37657 RepID=UPI003D779695